MFRWRWRAWHISRDGCGLYTQRTHAQTFNNLSICLKKILRFSKMNGLGHVRAGYKTPVDSTCGNYIPTYRLKQYGKQGRHFLLSTGLFMLNMIFIRFQLNFLNFYDFSYGPRSQVTTGVPKAPKLDSA